MIINKTLNYVGWSAASAAAAAALLKYGYKMTLFSAGGYTLATTAGATAVCFGVAKVVEHFFSKTLKLGDAPGTVVGIVVQGFIVAGGIYYKVILLTAASPLAIFVGGGGFVLYKLFDSYQARKQQAKEIDELKKEQQKLKEIKPQENSQQENPELNNLHDQFEKLKIANEDLDKKLKSEKDQNVILLKKIEEMSKIEPPKIEKSATPKVNKLKTLHNLGTHEETSRTYQQIALLQEKINKYKKDIVELESDIKQKNIKSLDEVGVRLGQVGLDEEWKFDTTPISTKTMKKEKNLNRYSLNLSAKKTDPQHKSSDILNPPPTSPKKTEKETENK